jgi:hypothetical protein
MGFSVDNTLKILLGVLGFAGFLTFVATAMDLPGAAVTPPVPVVAAAKPPVAPAPEAVNTPETGNENGGNEPIVVDEDDVSKEDIESFGEPTIELPGDDEENEVKTTASNGNQDTGTSSTTEGPAPPPPPAAR